MEQQDPEEERRSNKLQEHILSRKDSMRKISKEEGKVFANQNDTIKSTDLDGIHVASPTLEDAITQGIYTPRRFRTGSSIGQIFPRVKQKIQRSPLNSKRTARSYTLGSSRTTDSSDWDTEGSYDVSDSDFERLENEVKFNYFN